MLLGSDQVYVTIKLFNSYYSIFLTCTSFHTPIETLSNLLIVATKNVVTKSILLKEPFALKNSETVHFTSIFSTPSYSDIAPIDNFDLTFFYFYFVFEVFDTIKF